MAAICMVLPFSQSPGGILLNACGLQPASHGPCSSAASAACATAMAISNWRIDGTDSLALDTGSQVYTCCVMLWALSAGHLLQQMPPGAAYGPGRPISPPSAYMPHQAMPPGGFPGPPHPAMGPQHQGMPSRPGMQPGPPRPYPQSQQGFAGRGRGPPDWLGSRIRPPRA